MHLIELSAFVTSPSTSPRSNFERERSKHMWIILPKKSMQISGPAWQKHGESPDSGCAFYHQYYLRALCSLWIYYFWVCGRVFFYFFFFIFIFFLQFLISFYLFIYSKRLHSICQLLLTGKVLVPKSKKKIPVPMVEIIIFVFHLWNTNCSAVHFCSYSEPI